MATVTARKRTRRDRVTSTPEPLTAADKHRIAAEVTKELRGELIIRFDPDATICIRGWDDEESKGHQFYVSWDDQVDERFTFWVDARSDMPRVAIAKEMRERAEWLRSMADRVEGSRKEVA